MTALSDAAKRVLDAFYPMNGAKPPFIEVTVPPAPAGNLDEATPTADRLEAAIRTAAKDHTRKPDTTHVLAQYKRSSPAEGFTYVVTGVGS